MDDTVVISSSNVVAGPHCEDSSDAFLSDTLLLVQDVKEVLGETLRSVGTDTVSSIHDIQAPDPVADAPNHVAEDPFTNATVTVPLETGDKQRLRLRALRRKLQDAGMANLDWDGIDQELRTRRGGVEDR